MCAIQRKRKPRPLNPIPTDMIEAALVGVPAIYVGDLRHLFSRCSIEGDCWEFSGSKNKGGYGKIWVGEKCFYTHRFVLIAKGYDLDSLCACHRCDNPRCCNPQHLFAGSVVDNVYDAIAKGRNRQPPSIDWQNRLTTIGHGNSKLTPDDVRKIKARLASGEKQITIARDFDISSQAVSSIACRRRWGTVS